MKKHETRPKRPREEKAAPKAVPDDTLGSVTGGTGGQWSGGGGSWSGGGG